MATNDNTINIEHYFDWAGTSPVDKDILQDAMNLTFQTWGNPSSSHQVGKNAKLLLEQARTDVANIFGVPSNTIYFTSGGTESNQIPLLSLLSKPNKGTVLISSIEHPAVREQAMALKNCGWNIVSIPVNSEGLVEPETLTKLITTDTMLICIMMVNNETGIIQPIYKIADTITEYTKGKRKPKLHVDCVQALGKIPINLNYPGIDSASFTAHKICGPRGIGILYLKNQIEPFLKGGGQENGIRSGTENVFGAIAFSKVLVRYFNCNHLETQKKLTQDFIQELSKIPSCSIIPLDRLSYNDDFSPYVVQVAFKKIPGNVMLRALDSMGFYISTGSACSTKKNSRPILEAMNVSHELRENSVRFSFGPKTTEQGIKDLLQAIKKITNDFK